MTKKCEICGDEFTPTQKTQKYCKKKHYKKCPICGKKYLLKNNRVTKTCSNSCANEYRLKNIIYHNKCALCGDTFKTHTKHTKFCNKEHYSKCVVCDKKFIIKDLHRPASTCSQSCASSLTHTEKSKAKRKANSLKKYGTKYPFQAEIIKAKIKKSLDNSKNDTRIGSKRWSEMLEEKYGVENISQVEEIKEIKKQTYYEKYGVYNPAAMQVENYKEWNDFNNFVQTVNWDCLKLAKYFNVEINTVRCKASETNSEMYIPGFHMYSNPELEVKELLESFGLVEGVDFIPHDRKVIKPLELDFYLPKLNLGIEVSPTHTHNSKFKWWGKGEGLDKNYHYEKYIRALNKNIELITLFEWSDIKTIERIISSKLNVDSINYEYKEHLKFESVESFLKLNHQTYKGDKYKINALMVNDEYVAVFIWLENKKSKESTLKYSKFANEIVNSKFAFDFLLNNYCKTLIKSNINKIIINFDSSIQLDSQFRNLGFKIINEFKPRLNYHNDRENIYIKSSKMISNHKKALDKHGFLPVYDCGHKQWLMTIN